MLKIFSEYILLSMNTLLKVTVFVAILFSEISAQNAHRPEYGIEVKTHYAFLMTHYEFMRILQEQHFPIVQLNIFKTGNFGKEWQSLYRFPQYGISLIYSPLSSPRYLGNGFAVVPFINFSLFSNNRFSLKFFVGSGIGYIEKPFHIRENFKNEAIGSSLNAVLAAQTDFRYRISSSCEVSSGFSITHFSNGKYKTPNLGVNNLGIYFGISKHFDSNKSLNQSVIIEDNDRWENNFFFAMSSKQNYPVGGKNYFYSAYSYNIKRIISRKNKVGAGVDVFYDYSDRGHYKSLGLNKPDLTYIKPAVYVLHDFRISKVSIFIHIGTYLYTFGNNQDLGLIYDRIGIQYYFNNYFSTHFALKTHYARADCIEWALNLSF